MSQHGDCVLAVHPTQDGFGWVVFEGRAHLLDWGTTVVDRQRKPGSLGRFIGILEDWQPTVLVMEAFAEPRSRRSDWVQRLGRDILDIARAKNVERHLYRRREIQDVFRPAGAETRYEIACLIASQIEPLGHELPPKRKIWLSEPRRMGLFNAAAVALTHYALSASA